MIHRRRSLVVAGALVVLLAAIALFVLVDRPPGTTPVVTGITPRGGSVHGGQIVTITGRRFVAHTPACRGPTRVWFGTDGVEGFAISAVRFRVVSAQRITAVAPANYVGPVHVRVDNGCGASPTGASDRFTYAYPDDQCLSGACTVSVGSSPVGSLTHNADGLLEGYTSLRAMPSPRVRDLLDALALRQWRTAVLDLRQPTADPMAYCDRCRTGTAFSFDLTSDWHNAVRAAAPRFQTTPYADLAAYRRSVSADVAQRLALGQPITYFDIWNEPATGTIHAWLEAYGAAYEAIKTVDPRARVVGPSLDTLLTTSPGRPNAVGYKLNLTDFLDWEVATGIRFDALSWHEDGSPAGAVVAPGQALHPPDGVPGGRRDDWSPAAIGAHVLEARRLLDRYPSLRGTQLFVNEYGPPWAINIPGWMVGDITSIENSGADEAMMTCATESACARLFDGLLGYDEEPQMPYWVMRAYAEMRGERLAVTTSASNLFTLATRDEPARRVEVLLGRADDCWGPTACPQFHPSRAAPVRVSLSVTLPWRAADAQVEIRTLADDAEHPIGHNDVPVEPAVATITAPVVGGRVTVDLPAVRDGDAVNVTVSAEGGG